MGLKFSKLEATGNDFILIENGEGEDWAPLAQKICHRHKGVGADGLIVLLPSQLAPIKMRMFNPDGSEAEACGNGLRCLAQYLANRKLYPHQKLQVETLAGIREMTISGKIRVNMGKASFDIKQIRDYPLSISRRQLLVSLVSLGNPHAVLFTKEPVGSFPLARVGPKVENHPRFPHRTNFEIAYVVNRQQIRARVWERGAGETMSCGTGACAIAVAARVNGYIGDEVDIAFPGGTLTIGWDGKGDVFLSGEAREVFTGEWG